MIEYVEELEEYEEDGVLIWFESCSSVSSALFRLVESSSSVCAFDSALFIISLFGSIGLVIIAVVLVSEARFVSTANSRRL